MLWLRLCEEKSLDFKITEQRLNHQISMDENSDSVLKFFPISEIKSLIDEIKRLKKENISLGLDYIKLKKWVDINDH